MKEVFNRDNLKLAYSRLVTNPEDTYKNFFRDTYRTYGMTSEKNLLLLQKKLKAGYIPMDSVREFFPKANGLSRMYTLLSIEDQIVYQAYANVIAERLSANKQVKKRYKKTVFGNLYTDNASIFFYQRWQDSYRTYTQAMKKSYEKGNTYIASFDLTACYDSINHNVLDKLLRDRCHLSDEFVQTFTSLLKKWMSPGSIEISTGVPQGPQASGIIAEVVLGEYDAFVEKLKKKYSFDYFRYVDDIKILGDNDQTLHWILFLLDLKSKELGLFPQASKISVHKIEAIQEEINSISKPLFEDDINYSEKERSDMALRTLRDLLKTNPSDQTSIKRLIRMIIPGTKSNRLIIDLVQKQPNLIHTFAYYVKRYPRTLPPSICDYIHDCLNDNTKQFASGLLLECAFNKISDKEREKILDRAKAMINLDKQKQFIVDSRLKAYLISLVISSRDSAQRRDINFLNKCNWWIKTKAIYMGDVSDSIANYGNTFIYNSLKSDTQDIALAAAYHYLTADNEDRPRTAELSPIAQILFEQAGIINRKRINYTQINRYLDNIAEVKSKVQWKKKLGSDHDHLEKQMFIAMGYWKTDLTAFINLWDTIDDKLCSIIIQKNPMLGGYTLGNIGGMKDNKKLIAALPEFYSMCMEIHDLRLSSHLSHPVIKKTQQYTGPISSKKRRRIKKIINKGYQELVAFI